MLLKSAKLNDCGRFLANSKKQTGPAHIRITGEGFDIREFTDALGQIDILDHHELPAVATP
jgi:hypothetical protein